MSVFFLHEVSKIQDSSPSSGFKNGRSCSSSLIIIPLDIIIDFFTEEIFVDEQSYCCIPVPLKKYLRRSALDWG